jgi:hypothetical protein
LEAAEAAKLFGQRNTQPTMTRENLTGIFMKKKFATIFGMMDRPILLHSKKNSLW